MAIIPLPESPLLHPSVSRLGHHDRHEIALLIVAILSVVLVGTLGYIVIEGWNWFDSLYMTVITLATIGYGETHPLSTAGRAFTILLIVLGVGVVSVVLTSIAHKVIQREVRWIFKGQNVDKILANLKNHTILCGYGRLSRFAAARLKDANLPLLIVDQYEARCQEARDAGYLVFRGDVTLEETLMTVGANRAHRLVSLLPKESDNLYVILTARELNPSLYILSRAEDDASEKRLKRAGATKIVSPYRVGAQKIADGLLRLYVTDFIDLAGTTGGSLLIEELVIPPGSPLAGLTLKTSELRQRTNIIVAAIISPEGTMHFNPAGETVISEHSTIIGIGLRSDFGALEKMLVGG